MVRVLLTATAALLLGMGSAGQITVKIQRAEPADPMGGNFPAAYGTLTVQRNGMPLWKTTTKGLGCITGTKISPDEKYILAIGDGCGYMQLWSVDRGQRLITFLSSYWGGWGFTASFTPDSKRIVFNVDVIKTNSEIGKSSLCPHGGARLWDIKLNKCILALHDGQGEGVIFQNLAFTSDGKTMMLTDGYSPASIFNAFTGVWSQTFSRYEGHGAFSGSFSHDSKQVTVNYVSGAVVQYDVKSGRVLRVVKPSTM